MSRWLQGPQEEPERGPQPEQMQAYSGPWTDQFFRVTIFMTVNRADLEPFPAKYVLIIPDYNMDAFQNTLNSNGVVYTVEPIARGDIQEGGEPIDES